MSSWSNLYIPVRLHPQRWPNHAIPQWFAPNRWYRAALLPHQFGRVSRIDQSQRWQIRASCSWHRHRVNSANTPINSSFFKLILFPAHLECERLIEDRTEGLTMYFCFEFLFLIGQQIDLHIGIWGATHVEGWQLFGLYNSYGQTVRVEIVFKL